MAGSITHTLAGGPVSLLAFRALASGSSGNGYLLTTRKVSILIEVGLRISKLRDYLAAEGISPDALTAAVLTHEHTDHCVGASDLSRLHGVPICANVEVLKATGLDGLPEATALPVGVPTSIGDVEITPFPVSHDAVRPVGFFLRVGSRSIAIATDLGRATDEVTEVISAADLVVLEANHDLAMLRDGRYPPYLRKRVAGATGHLSNDQAGAVLADHLSDRTAQVWLAHLSKENNSPRLALRTVRRHLAAVGRASMKLAVAGRDKPSLRWNGDLPPRQLDLFPTGALDS